MKLRRARRRPPTVWQTVLELSRSGPAALAAEQADVTGPLRIAIVIPSFRRGSGGHSTIVRLAQGLSARGHSVSLWLEDCDGRHAGQPAPRVAQSFAEFFAAAEPGLRVGFEAWEGADVVLATGWQTVPRALLLPGAGARAYLVQDHEPEFYGASAEALVAADTYRRGLHCIAASPWLAELLRRRYGASASHFDLAVDHALYAPPAQGRRADLVVFYARLATPRRAVPLGLLALEELARRRPDVEIALFGDEPLPATSFSHTALGILDGGGLADLYGRATVGLALSLTNPSLVGLEMMACGLPGVELASESMLQTFGADGPLELAGADPLELCRAIERLLDDSARRRRAEQLGLELIRGRTWQRAAEQVEAGLLAAIQSGAAG